MKGSFDWLSCGIPPIVLCQPRSYPKTKDLFWGQPNFNTLVILHETIGAVLLISGKKDQLRSFIAKKRTAKNWKT
jgi:hypothetical protein